ncbi:MAG: thiamine pyrophosphate-dependent enzyme, partial [Myxococcota bacterium]|nr:thiamine pyrophosphate-dependent enzyme [Myxococcota bacterium]
PLSYFKTKAIFGTAEKKNPGSGGLFSIFVSDLCKGCAACVTACGDHMALRMVPDSESVNESVVTGMNFLDTLKNTEQKHLGRYDNQRPQDAKVGVLKNHLMVRDNYDALVSGDGACAGCGEKSVLRALATVTEAYMRPLYHAKADRLVALADRIMADGPGRMSRLAEQHPEQHALMRRSVAHTIMGLGGETDADTDARLDAYGELKDATILDALATVMRQDAHNHRDIQANDGRLANGMSVMAMAAHTGCNTVYGSTPPNNPHPYPWMNSLFQDGATIGWTMAESMNVDHGRRSVIPERLATALLDRDDDVITDADYFDYTHFSDALMTDDEVNEMPRVWVIGGDGGMGDIGFQNVSKVVLQNRPNVQMLMLDTQVYSNTGGQNSDSTPMPGGGDMNGIGMATQGKMSEKKSVAETFTAGHGSPYVGQVSMANPTKLYRSMIEGLEYRGTAFFQCFTTCQPEHGVADDMSTEQALAIRDTRGMPEFVFNPAKGETYGEALDLKGNPNVESDWATKRNKTTKEPYRYMIPHWASTEARFRRHFKPMDPTKLGDAIHLENMLLCLSQDDVVKRRFLRRDHRSYVPDFEVYIELERPAGMVPTALSRQMVLFCVERRKAWRMLQSKAGIDNVEYRAHRALLAKMDSGELTRADILERGSDLLQDEVNRLKAN